MTTAHLARPAGRLAAAALLGSCLLAPGIATAAGLSMKGLAGGLAHEICTAEFVSGRTLEDLKRQEFAGSPMPAKLLDDAVKIDRTAGAVAVGAPFPAEATALMRPGLGCVLAAGRPVDQLMALHADGPARSRSDRKALWPRGDRADATRPIRGVDRARLDRALDVAFGQCPAGRDPFTRAIVVAHDGRIVAERYGKGFGPEQRLYGASMSKAVAATLLGLRIAEGRMALDGVALPPAPHRPDPITNRQLVNMTAGLAWNEDADGAPMLLEQPDTAAFAAARPAVSKPGAVFNYSSGATNILMASLRHSFAGDHQAYLNYPRKALFDPLGMRSALFQPDAAGTFAGSTYVWASARDWARLGLLYLQEGRWSGRQLLPRSWVTFVRTPAPATADAPGEDRLGYGAGFRLRGAEAAALPAPTFLMRGRGGQTVVIDPARSLVVVRLGYTLDDCPTAGVDPIINLFPAKASKEPS